MTLLSSAAEARGADQGYAFALVNLLSAAAQVADAAGGSRLAQAAGDAAPYLSVLALFAVALAVTLSRRPAAARPQRSPPPARG